MRGHDHAWNENNLRRHIALAILMLYKLTWSQTVFMKESGDANSILFYN